MISNILCKPWIVAPGDVAWNPKTISMEPSPVIRDGKAILAFPFGTEVHIGDRIASCMRAE